MNIIGGIIIVAIIVFIALFFGTLILHGNDECQVWVNIRTGEEVIVEGDCEIIDPETNRKVDGIIYHTALGHYIYTIRYNDFVLYFKPKKEYENK